MLLLFLALAEHLLSINWRQAWGKNIDNMKLLHLSLAIIGTQISLIPAAAIATPSPQEIETLSTVLEQRHLDRLQQLSTDQIAALNQVYPGFRILTSCAGRFSRRGANELVLGIWKPVLSDPPGTRAIQRVGLIRSQQGWQVHSIDDELEQDQALSRSFPMYWQYSLSDSVFIGQMKCGIKSEFGQNSDLKYGNGNRPLFNLKKAGLQNNKVVCFSTSDVYNNWDCLVYSPKDRRFRLWYQQVYAD
jgi:hypothetical protein